MLYKLAMEVLDGCQRMRNLLVHLAFHYGYMVEGAYPAQAVREILDRNYKELDTGAVSMAIRVADWPLLKVQRAADWVAQRTATVGDVLPPALKEFLEENEELFE